MRHLRKQSFVLLYGASLALVLGSAGCSKPDDAAPAAGAAAPAAAVPAAPATAPSTGGVTVNSGGAPGAPTAASVPPAAVGQNSSVAPVSADTLARKDLTPEQRMAASRAVINQEMARNKKD